MPAMGRLLSSGGMGSCSTSHGREIFDALRSLALPQSDYAIFGSGPLLVRGIITRVADLDVVCRGAAWEAAQTLAAHETYEHGVRVLSIGAISFGRTWGLGEFDLDRLIDDAEWIEGLPFVRLDHVIAYKRFAARPKDRSHLELIDAWQADQRRRSLPRL